MSSITFEPTTFAPRFAAISDTYQIVAGNLRRLKARLIRRGLEAQVRALSNHQLKDIGILRSQIGFVVPAAAER